jgi:predicted permease
MTATSVGDSPLDLLLLRDWLLLATLLNYVVLLAWFLVFCGARARLLRLHQRWFGITAPTFDAIHYAGMALYKVGILLLCLVPYVALRIALAHHGT